MCCVRKINVSRGNVYFTHIIQNDLIASYQKRSQNALFSESIVKETLVRSLIYVFAINNAQACLSIH